MGFPGGVSGKEGKVSHVQLFETPMSYTVHGILQSRIPAFPFW